MNIAISGGTGFIGKHLTAFLTDKGYQVIPLGRAMFRDNMAGQLVQILSHCDVIINLAGASINKRWTEDYKKELYSSRIHVTHKIVQALYAIKQKPQLLISASAVGYYPMDGCYDEYSTEHGEGFLSELCQCWEREAAKCPPQTRLAITRFGVVLSPNGGAFVQMYRPLKMKVAAVIGPGTQLLPWIDIRDLTRIIEFIMQNPSLNGVINLVAPQQVTHDIFTRELAFRYHAWVTVTIPATFFRWMYGEASSFLTTGQHVIPTKLVASGYDYTSSNIEKFVMGTNKHTVNQLDLKRYMGKWYEIARFDHRFERGLVGVTATYTLQPDGTVRVVNAGHVKELNGRLKKAKGRAKLPNPHQPGKLKVSFFLWFYSDYYVFDLDEKDYSYALVGSSSDNYLWILSRTPQLPEEVLEKLLTDAKERGYDINKLIWIPQKEE